MNKKEQADEAYKVLNDINSQIETVNNKVIKYKKTRDALHVKFKAQDKVYQNLRILANQEEKEKVLKALNNEPITIDKDLIIKHMQEPNKIDVRFIKEETDKEYGVILYFETTHYESNGGELDGEFTIKKNIFNYNDDDLSCHTNVETIEGVEYIACGC